MRLKSFLKRLFGGEIIEKFGSAINGEILVVKELSGKTVMRVGGIAQSGGLVEEIWKVVFNKLKAENRQPKTVLILGLGAGTAAKILTKKWPGIKIVGVEIDPVVVKIGKKYFGLDKIPNLKLVKKDAFFLVKDSKFINVNPKFGLILVDLYLGQEFPQKAESRNFLNSLKQISAKNSLIVFNRLNFGEHKKETEDFYQKLNYFFSKTSLIKTSFNHFFVCESASQKV